MTKSSIAVEADKLPAHIRRHIGNLKHVNVHFVDETAFAVHIGSQQWSEGSRDLYHVAHLDSDLIRPVHDPRPWPTNMGELGAVELAPRFVIIRTGTFCGKPSTPCVYARAADVVQALPAPAPELNLVLKGVLAAVACYNSKGRETFRNDIGMSKTTWDLAIVELAKLGLTTPRGGITVTGRNAASRDVWQLESEIKAYVRGQK